MDVKEYKKFHEDHMRDNLGTSFGECLILVLTIPLSTFFSSFAHSHSYKLTTFIFEFVTVLSPILLNCTVFSNVNHILFVFHVCFFVLILLAGVSSLGEVLNSKVENYKSSITNYRSSTNFVSVLCILAVDFNVFPKRLAKTETFGFGFMDLGVGFFLFSNGIVKKGPVTMSQLPKLVKSVSVLLLLGFIRVVSVKSIDYHEHVSEYGVHWNFFFTLALCHLIAYFITLSAKNLSPQWLAILTAALHQSLLSFGLQDWVLSNVPRNSFLSANREGLVSCLGYVSLYFAASAVGNFIFKSEKRTYKTFLRDLSVLCMFVWLGTAICFGLFPVSRRLVNLGYIFWTLGLSCTLLLSFIFGEIILLSVIKGKKSLNCVPGIFEHINANGLFFFLFGNLLTGLINAVFQTLLLGKLLSLALIICYMFVLTGVTFLLYEKKIFLKL